MAIHKMTPNGPEPSKWPVELYADVGADEEFVKRMIELPQLVDAGQISGQQREEVRHAIIQILMEGLIPAFLKLREIRGLKSRSLPLMDRQQLYEDFARKLWRTYKDLTEKAVREMGLKIRFLYDNDKKFKDGLAEFRQQNPRIRDWFEEVLMMARDEWQGELAKFRNSWVEHPHAERKKFAKFYTPEYAEFLFDKVWKTIADILPALLELYLPFGARLIEQDENDPGLRWPQRFQYVFPRPTDTK